MRRRSSSPQWRLSGGLAVAAAVLVGLAATPAAFAHAIIIETSPTNGVVLATPPGEVVLRFNEPVETAFGSVKVYDKDAHPIGTGETTRPSSEQVAVTLPPNLASGTYTVAWRVVSADSHPVHGAFLFSVGSASPGGGVVEEVLDAESGSEAVDGTFAVARFLTFSLLLLCAGGVAMLAGVLPWLAEIRRRLWLVVAGCAGGLALLSLVGIGLQGASAAGLGLGSAFRSSLISDVLDTQFGKVWLARAILAALLAGIALALSSRLSARERALRPLTVGLAGALVLTPALAGHAHVEGWYAVVADSVHVAAASMWTGGLAFLMLALLWARSARWSFASRAVPRYSIAALVSVGALIVTGAISGILEVSSVSGLWDTTYGRLLLAKIALLFPLLALGAFNNRFSVPRLRSGAASVRDRRRFVGAAAIELTIFVAVLGVTAALVAEPPAKAVAAVASGPVSRDVEVGPFDLNMVIDPAATGANEMHLYLLNRTTGQPASVDEARVSASLPEEGIGPLQLTSTPGGPGHYILSGAIFPIAGTWTFRIDVRRGDFDEWSVSIPAPIRKGSP